MFTLHLNSDRIWSNCSITCYCYKGETRSKLDFLICGTNIFLQIPVPYVFFRDRFFFFFFNWRIPLSVFNSCAIFVVRPTKMMRNEGIIQFIKHTWGFLTDNFNCKHCNFQSSMFTSSFLEKCCISAWEEFSRQVLETAALD